MRNRIGQAAILGLIMAFMLVAVFSVTLPILFDFLEIGLNGTDGAVNEGVIDSTINLIPVFMALIVLIAIVLLIIGRTG
jgi:hypothetical protein